MIPEVPKKKTRPMVLLFLACILLAIVVFGDVLPPGRVLFTTDDNIGVLARSKQALPNKFLGGWASSPLLGKPQEALINWTNLLLWLSPLKLFTNWIHALDLALGSWFLALFLRARGLTWPAVALGTLTGFWLGMTFTLIYSGHLGKFGVVLFAALSLWLTEKAVQKLSMPFASFAGAAWGLMMLEQADVALFFLLALGPYTLHALARDHAGRRRTWARVLIPQVAVSLLVSMPALATGWRHQVAGAAIVQTADADREWNFATEWSWPPEELIDLIAPGYMGWRSHDPSGPYWGRTGRSAGWEETQRGFRNFKLDNN